MAVWHVECNWHFGIDNLHLDLRIQTYAAGAKRSITPLLLSTCQSIMMRNPCNSITVNQQTYHNPVIYVRTCAFSFASNGHLSYMDHGVNMFSCTMIQRNCTQFDLALYVMGEPFLNRVSKWSPTSVPLQMNGWMKSANTVSPGEIVNYSKIGENCFPNSEAHVNCFHFPLWMLLTASV